MAQKENPVKKFFKDLSAKLDQKLLEKAKQPSCCDKPKKKCCS